MEEVTEDDSVGTEEAKAVAEGTEKEDLTPSTSGSPKPSPAVPVLLSPVPEAKKPPAQEEEKKLPAVADAAAVTVPATQEPAAPKPPPEKDDRDATIAELQKKQHDGIHALCIDRSVVMLENHRLRNEVDSKSTALKDLRREIDELKSKFEEEKLVWRTKEADYAIKIQSAAPPKKPTTSDVKTTEM